MQKAPPSSASTIINKQQIMPTWPCLWRRARLNCMHVRHGQSVRVSHTHHHCFIRAAQTLRHSVQTQSRLGSLQSACQLQKLQGVANLPNNGASILQAAEQSAHCCLRREGPAILEGLPSASCSFSSVAFSLSASLDACSDCDAAALCNCSTRD